jgi:STE24 endopeptidase
VAAVFGHELGHVAHRHLPFFGFFFLGSLGLLSLVSRFFTLPPAWFEGLPWIPANQIPRVGEFVEAALLLGFLGVFFWVVFGHLSRRFERQADVFGCKVVSCGVWECPPHFDLEEGNYGPEAANSLSPALCPVGIQIFSDALTKVACQNGIDATARSWRHGSIANRLTFLRRLQADPGGERFFQRSLRSFRLMLAILGSAGLRATPGQRGENPHRVGLSPEATSGISSAAARLDPSSGSPREFLPARTTGRSSWSGGPFASSSSSD